jgi:hypothetical protein
MSLSTYYITRVSGESCCLSVAALSKTAQTRPAQPRRALSAHSFPRADATFAYPRSNMMVRKGISMLIRLLLPLFRPWS